MIEESQSFKIQTVNRRFLPFDSEKEKQWQGPFFFIQGADCQPGLTYLWTDTGRMEPTSDMPMKWDIEIEATRAVIKKINQMKPKPKFFIVCGDIVDAFPFEEPFRSQQEKDIKNVFNELDPSIPLVCVCGNHDIGNEPTRESIQSYINNFGDDYFDFYCGGIHCIVINSQFYAHSLNVEDLKLKHEQWLDNVLKDKQSKHIIIFQHLPWFLNEYNEENEYFNIEINLRIKMLEKFHLAGVKKIFCGHYHRNAGGLFKSMEQVITSAIGLQLGNDKSGVRLVRVTENDIEHQYFPTEDIPLNFL
ncbi:unnamed protein product [Rotaria sp. Silwood1]|nr:unnamed protein product [Rotaria sp. Silwood1]CAF1346713.1 unnamed protein product [Rotaria sp. Silwood1]CAF3564530.1 unnamed protein product [Rotaria sp. Silwood1]CAF3569635.1 unnamed protein product [Rotaria sp. Silwood1]CAF3578149.1 unnamed protein product [Rotaria sp. Silwood1]